MSSKMSVLEISQLIPPTDARALCQYIDDKRCLVGKLSGSRFTCSFTNTRLARTLWMSMAHHLGEDMCKTHHVGDHFMGLYHRDANFRFHKQMYPSSHTIMIQLNTNIEDNTHVLCCPDKDHSFTLQMDDAIVFNSQFHIEENMITDTKYFLVAFLLRH